MMNYVRGSYFNNVKPQKLLPRIPIRRDRLLKKMLRNRSAIKYIYAPSGYGKSSSAFDYVDFNHNWQNVFWFNCQSGCFKRDIDSDTLLDQIFQVCDSPNVIVFDDLIELKGKLKSKFMDVVQELINIDCDVVITQNSTLYGAIALNHDTNYIFGYDLCVSENEAMSAKMYGSYDGFNFMDNSICQCPPCLIFSKTGLEDLILSPRSATTSDLEITVIFLIYVFKFNYISILERFIDRKELLDIIPIIVSKYPHIGIDNEMTLFQTVSIDYELLSDAFKPMLSVIVNGSKFGNLSNFIDEVTNQICEYRGVSLAYEFASLFGDNANIQKCITEKFSNILINCEYTLAYDSLQRIDNLVVTEDPLIGFYKCCLFAYTRESTYFFHTMSKFSISAPEQVCIYAPCKLMSYAYMFEELNKLDIENISEMIFNNSVTESKFYKSVSIQYDIESCRLLSKFLLIQCDNHYESLNMLEKMVSNIDIDGTININAKDCSAQRNSGLVGLFLAYIHICLNLLNLARRGQSYEGAFETYLGKENRETGMNIFEKISNKMVLIYDTMLSGNCVSWQLLDALLRMEDIWGAYNDSPECFDNSSFVDVSRAIDLNKDSIKKLEGIIVVNNDTDKTNKSKSTSEFPITKYRTLDKNLINSKVEISIFSKNNIKINSQSFPLTTIGTKKGRYIIALLAIANFSEMHRDSLIEDLFPLKSIHKRSTLSNFYSLISSLKKSLAEYGADNCIIKNSLGYKLNSQIVSTDYDAFDLLVNDFMFNVGCTDSWEEPYSRLKDKFSVSAFECLIGNKAIDSYRIYSTNRLVDALLSATSRLLEQADTFGALTLSRQAYELDDKREDVYVSLIRAQSFAHQRSQAIETFFECKNFLSKELGIAPSKKLIDEYEKLIL